MGYLNKHINDIRSGFGAAILITGIFLICPLVIAAVGYSF